MIRSFIYSSNNMKRIILILIIISASLPLHAVTLKWDIPLNNRLELIRTAWVKYLSNKQLENSYIERNIIDLTCYDKRDSSSAVRGTFSVYEKKTEEGVFHLREQHPTDFIITDQGKYLVDEKYYMPNLRHIPTFPDEDIKQGDRWGGEAELILTNFSAPFKLIFPVRYELADITTLDDVKAAVISYEYIIDYDLTKGSYPSDFPLKIFGKNKGVIYWDIDGKRPHLIQEKYTIVFIYRTGIQSLGSGQFEMNIETKSRLYSQLSQEEKEKEKEELKKIIPEDKDIVVDTDKRGLVLRLGDVLFDFDSYTLKNETKQKLETIASIIRKKYLDRELIIEGHTDNIGEKDYNYRLSRQRAREVTEYLKSKTDHDKLSYRGFGSEKPITDNKTKKGRQKNRRVEIIIKLE